MSSVILPKLYPVTDARLSGLSHAEQVGRLCAGGASFIQLREKNLSPREYHLEVEAALRVARSRSARLIVNDRADIALAAGADGVHLGQDDLPVEAARALLGDDAVIGYSTHTVEQAIAAARLPVSYIAIGPVYETRTKEKPDPQVGLDGVRRVREAVPRTIPLIAIGGITRENARAVLEAGADSVAVVSALLKTGGDPSHIANLTSEFLSAIG